MLRYNSKHSFTSPLVPLKPFLLPFPRSCCTLYSSHLCPWRGTALLWPCETLLLLVESSGFTTDLANRAPAFSLGVPTHMATSPTYAGEETLKRGSCLLTDSRLFWCVTLVTNLMLVFGYSDPSLQNILCLGKDPTAGNNTGVSCF